MASARKKLSAIAILTVLGSSGYYLYSVFAAQGQGALAQAPLNIQSSIRPAFIMAVDNSGSMGTDQTLFRTDDGRGFYCNAAGKVGFFAADGSPNEEDECSGATTFTEAIDISQQSDAYGALRAPEYNRAYYNPATVYLPWRKADGDYEANSPINAAKEDPRSGGTTFDFTKAEKFTLTPPLGSVIPKGTRYRNLEAVKVLCGSTSFVTASADVKLPAVVTCKLEFEYYRARVYLSDGVIPPAGFDTSKRILVAGAGPLGKSLWRYDFSPSNFTSNNAYNASLQNFANYWTYNGNRNRAMISGMTQSLGDVTNMRVGYFQINPSPPTGNVKMYDLDVEEDRADLYGKMRALNASGGTPTRTATAYMVKQFRRTDSDAPVQLVCQKNAGMLFTDGFTNENSVSGGFNVGNTDSALPAPFGGGVASSNTIADFAADGYFNNLRPTLTPGKVSVPNACSASNPDPKLDCNKNLHMNFYGVTLGARGKVYGVDANATRDPYRYPPAWAATGTTFLQPENVDDIWHASLTSRGEFINAQSPSAISEAMRRILASVGAGTTPSGSIAVTGSRIGDGSLTVVPEYTSTNNGTDWYSKLIGQTVTSSTLGVAYNTLWEASGLLPDAGARNILFGRTTGDVKPIVSNFDGSLVSLNDLCSDSLSTCTRTGDRSIATRLGVDSNRAVAYLRGDTSLEVAGSTGKLRARTTRLGDIVNSSPIVSAPTDDYGYQSLAGNTAGTYDPFNYTAYLTTKKTRKPMVYVGANDGMFHAVDAKTGVETFAYVPHTSLGHMGNLLFPYNADDKEAQIFNHRYFVDGPIAISDVYDGSAWKTIAVGTSGAGGRSVFAIDVSNPGGFDASKVLWELNDSVSVGTIKDQIGNVLGRPIIVPVKASNGAVRWKAIFGNGYGSKNKDAVLFVVDVLTGAADTYKAKESGTLASENGLGNLIALDSFIGTGSTYARDGYVDTVYAGDQNGAVWKFDLRDNKDPKDPLFIATDSAGNRQAILGGFEATAGPGGGVMVYFGTGSFSFANDPADKQVMSLYGVLDRLGTTTGFKRSSLQQQKILADNGNARTLTTNTLILGSLGWYVDLGVASGTSVIATGERSVGYPVIANGVIFFPTFDPSTTDSCTTLGINRLYGLSALSGGGALSQVRIGSLTGTSPGVGTGALKLDSSGSAPVKDVAVLTTRRMSPLDATATTEVKEAALDAKCSMVVQAPGSSKLYLPRPCGRQSWRQVK